MIKIEFSNQERLGSLCYKASYTEPGIKKTTIRFESIRLINSNSQSVNISTGIIEPYIAGEIHELQIDAGVNGILRRNPGLYRYAYDTDEGRTEVGKIFIGKKPRRPTIKKKGVCFGKRTTVTIKSEGLELTEGDVEIHFTGRSDGKTVNVAVPLCITGKDGKFTILPQKVNMIWKIVYSDTIKMITER